MQASFLNMHDASSGSGVYPEPEERLVWLDLLKVVSAFAVVMTHIASIGWQAIAPSDEGWFVTSVYEIVTRFAVPAFFMTSGALLLNPRRKLGLRRVLMGYLPKTAFLALFVSLLFCVLQSILYGWQGWRFVILGTLDGPYFIWYLWVLVGLYALTPLLRLISARPDALGYSVVLLAVFVMGRSTADAMLPGSPLTVFLDNFILFSSGMEGVFYYLLGAWLISHPIRGGRGWAVVLVGGLSVLLAIFLNYRDALANGQDLYYVARDNALIALFSVGVWEAFYLIFSRVSGCRALDYLVRWGMTIYLSHPFFRLAMEGIAQFRLAVDWLLSAPLVSIPVVSVLIWIMSVCFAGALGLVRNVIIRSPLLRAPEDDDR